MLLHKLLPVTLFVGILASSASFAENEAEKEQMLDQILQRIDQLKQVMGVKQDSKSKYSDQLKSIERGIGDLSVEIDSIGKQIRQKKSALKTLASERNQHKSQIKRETKTLSEQIYTAFTLGQQEKVKLLFSQQDPQVLQRNLIFYQYFSNARVELIDGVKRNLEKVIETENLIRQARAELEKNQHKRNQQKARLDNDRAKRKGIIKALNKELQKEGGTLAKLQGEATELQNLIDSIGDIFSDAPEEETVHKAFAEMRGGLKWPVRGKLRKLYGRQKTLSDLRWQGVMIEAPRGRHVRAVSHGRIAFADWLRGMGNIIIIDHGNSYLSLYGHNEALFKSAGAWVEAGDIISSIGNSGGRSKAGLYFEIRGKGKPQNPTKWCEAGKHWG